MLFTMHESSFQLIPEVVDDLLRDRLAFVMFRQAVDVRLCSAISSRFWTSPLTRNRNDNVPGRIIGTFHYLKQPDAYLNESSQALRDIDAFFDVLPNPLDRIVDELDGYFRPRGVNLRVGTLRNRQFCPLVLRSWEGTGEYQLKPHDDSAQLTYPPQEVLELTRVTPTSGALNICLENKTSGSSQGAVRIWNSRPVYEERHRLDIQFSGYPYPPEILSKFVSLEIPIFPGDAYMINGKYIHAVVGGGDSSPRLTLASMFGYCSDETVIYWS